MTIKKARRNAKRGKGVKTILRPRRKRRAQVGYLYFLLYGFLVCFLTKLIISAKNCLDGTLGGGGLFGRHSRRWGTNTTVLSAVGDCLDGTLGGGDCLDGTLGGVGLMRRYYRWWGTGLSYCKNKLTPQYPLINAKKRAQMPCKGFS